MAGSARSYKYRLAYVARRDCVIQSCSFCSPRMVHVAPGKRGKIDRTLNRAGEFRFGCLLQGHFDAGMVGAISVSP